jgi:hypothetical protein
MAVRSLSSNVNGGELRTASEAFDCNDAEVVDISKHVPKPTSTECSSVSLSQRRELQLILGLVAITSPLTATIYFPLRLLLRENSKRSAPAIILTNTLCIVFQAISPVIFGPLSDVRGRRPYFHLTLALYAVGNVGLALNEHNYVLLLLLRAT